MQTMLNAPDSGYNHFNMVTAAKRFFLCTTVKIYTNDCAGCSIQKQCINFWNRPGNQKFEFVIQTQQHLKLIS